VYRSSITEVEYESYQNVDTSSEDYDTACSESSFATCLSHSVSADSDLELETLSSSSSDTVVEEIFSGEEVEFNLADHDHQLRTGYILSSKARWNADAEDLLQTYQRR
jgi:hypothetical protein